MQINSGTMPQAELTIGRGRLIGILLANAVLWAAALLVVGDWRLGPPAAAALITIASLFAARRKSV